MPAEKPDAAIQGDFFVSPKGNDSWSGRLPDPAGNDGPFATIERARDAVRTLRASEKVERILRVVLRAGTYHLDRPVELGPEDTGMEIYPDLIHSLVFAAAPGETAVISGGRRLQNGHWGELNGHKAWVYDLPDVKSGAWRFTQLFVNGKRRPRTRLPKTGEYHVASIPGLTPENAWNGAVKSFVYSGNDLQPWRNQQDIEIVAVARWVDFHLGIKSIDVENHLVTLDRPTRAGLTELDNKTMAAYWVENVLEAFDTAGLWYLDRPSGRLYYMPLPGEEMEKTEVIAPRLPEVLRIVGRKEAPAKYIHFEGITFAHTEWQLPAGLSAYCQAAFSVPGAIFLSHAHQCSFSRCVVEHLGGYGIQVAAGCLDIHITHSRLTDIGAGGVRIDDDSSRTTVSDNKIAHVGRIFLSAVGVLISNCPGNTITYNRIHDLYYSGISAGWRWDFIESNSFGNIIEHNHIHDIGQGMLSDLAGIYTLGVSTGTRIRYNVIHDVSCRFYTGAGFYTDSGSADILFEKNLVYRVSSELYFPHINRNIKVENNIFAFGGKKPIRLGAYYPWIEYELKRNIFYYNQGQLVSGDWITDRCACDRNVYWNASGAPVIVADRDFSEWQKAGQDKNSVIADPLFVDLKKDDFRLRPESPALKLGFEPWDLSDVGPRPFVKKPLQQF